MTKVTICRNFWNILHFFCIFCMAYLSCIFSIFASKELWKNLKELLKYFRRSLKKFKRTLKELYHNIEKTVKGTFKKLWQNFKLWRNFERTYIWMNFERNFEKTLKEMDPVMALQYTKHGPLYIGYIFAFYATKMGSWESEDTKATPHWV